ncbi:UNVERIFIED_CONTAM: Cysteine-rich venom protein 6 [Trichonephila clavipes]
MGNAYPLIVCEKCECSKPNEEFRECGPPCITTCARIDPRRKCPDNCVKGCFCKSGFVRDINGNCIRPENCPIGYFFSFFFFESESERCPEGEIYYACTPTCGSTCDTQSSESRRSCSQVCRPGCFCRKGFVKTRDGTCVLPQNCPENQSKRQNSGYHNLLQKKGELRKLSCPTE